MATQHAARATADAQEPLSVTLSEASARAWIVSTLLSDLGDLPVHPKMELFAERLLMVEEAIHSLRDRFDHLDESDPKAVRRTADIAATTYEAAHKVLNAMQAEPFELEWLWTNSQLALLQAASALCRETARTLDRACGLGIWVLPHQQAA